MQHATAALFDSKFYNTIRRSETTSERDQMDPRPRHQILGPALRLPQLQTYHWLKPAYQVYTMPENIVGKTKLVGLESYRSVR